MAHYSAYDGIPNSASYDAYHDPDRQLSRNHPSTYPHPYNNPIPNNNLGISYSPDGKTTDNNHISPNFAGSSSLSNRYSLGNNENKASKSTKQSISNSRGTEYYHDNPNNVHNSNNSSSSSSYHHPQGTDTTPSSYPPNQGQYDDTASTNYNETRTTRACEACHRAKAKCQGDGIVPCSSCIRRNIECVYVEQKKRGPKTGALKALQVELNTLRAALKTGTTSTASGTPSSLNPSSHPNGGPLSSVSSTVVPPVPTNSDSGGKSTTDSKNKNKRNRPSNGTTPSSVSNPTPSVPSSSSHIISNATTPKGGYIYNNSSTTDPYAAYTPSSSSSHHHHHHHHHDHHTYPSDHHHQHTRLQPLPNSSGNEYPIPEYTYYGTYHGIPPTMGAWITLPSLSHNTNIGGGGSFGDSYSSSTEYMYDNGNMNQEVCDFMYPHSEPIIASHENEVKYIRLYFLYSNAVLPMVCKTDFYYAGIKLRLWDMLASVCEDTIPVCDHDGGDCASMSFAPLSAFSLQQQHNEANIESSIPTTNGNTVPSSTTTTTNSCNQSSFTPSLSLSTTNNKFTAPSVRQASLLGAAAFAGNSGSLTPSSLPPPLLTSGPSMIGMTNGLGSPNEGRSLSPLQRLPLTAASNASFLYGGDDDENAFVGSWQIGRRTTTTNTHEFDNSNHGLESPFLTGSSISNYHQQQNELYIENNQQSMSSSSASSTVIHTHNNPSSSSSLSSSTFLASTNPAFGSASTTVSANNHHNSIITPVQSDDDNDENSAGHEVRKRIANLHPLPKGLLRPPKRYVRATPELVEAHLKRLSTQVLAPSSLTQGRLEACKAAYYGVLAIGARMDLQPLLADAYFNRARKALSRCFDEPCIETISGSMLCAYYMCGVAATGDMLRAKLYISLANEMADGLETSVAAVKRRERINTFSSDRPKEQQQQQQPGNNTNPSNVHSTDKNNGSKTNSSSQAVSKKRKVAYDLKPESTNLPVVVVTPPITPSSSTDSGIPQDILLSVRFLAQMTSAYRSGTVPALRAVSINSGNGTNANDSNEIDSPRGRVSRILAHVTDKTRRRVSTPDQLRRIAPQLLEALGEAERIDREFHVGAPMDFNTQAAIHTSRAVVLHACGDIDQALKYAEKALEVMNTELRHFLAYVCASVLVQLIPIFMAGNRMDKVKIVVSYLHDLSQMWPVGYVLLAKASRRVSYAQQQLTSIPTSSSSIAGGIPNNSGTMVNTGNTLSIKTVQDPSENNENSQTGNGTKTNRKSDTPVTPLDRLASVTETFGEPVHDDDNDEHLLPSSSTHESSSSSVSAYPATVQETTTTGEAFIKTSLESFIASPVMANNQSFLARLPSNGTTGTSTHTANMETDKFYSQSQPPPPPPSTSTNRTLSDLFGLRTTVSTNSFGVPVRSSSSGANTYPGNGNSFSSLPNPGNPLTVMSNDGQDIGPSSSTASSSIPPPPTAVLTRPKHSYSSNSIGATSTSSSNSRNSMNNNPNTTLVGGLGWDIDDFLFFEDMPLPSPLGTPYAPLVLSNHNNNNNNNK